MGGPGSGRGGLAVRTVHKCERLLDAGVGPYYVAAKLGIHVSTVYRIQQGAHFLQLLMDEETFERCSGCGALIERRPCLLCELRKAGL